MGTVKEGGLIAKALHVVHREVGHHRAEVRPVGWEAGGVAQHPGWVVTFGISRSNPYFQWLV